MSEGDVNNRQKNFISVLIALTAVSGALVSWQAARVAGRASGADGQAITAALEEAGTEMSIASDLYGFLTDTREFDLAMENARMIRDEAMRNPSVPDRWVEEWQAELIKARTRQVWLNTDYIQRESGRTFFEAERFTHAVRAQNASEKALDPAPFLQRSEECQGEARLLAALNILFTAAIFCFTVVLKTDARRLLPWIVLGTALYLAGAGTALWRILA